MADPTSVAQEYFDALSAKDFATVAAMFADDIRWHQPGGNRFSGTHDGSAAVGALLAGMTTVSDGSFELTLTGPLMANGALVAAPVHFAAKRDGAVMDQDGVDVLRVEDGRIAEVWLFSGDAAEEDDFWGAA
ncbi:nuclear transport factor 2 family protein [Amycolatopsis sp.]|uniref:nuclear transport factor 2 family protein n=1 Tax=Amycolatopsis sp. TaxID=37632 RepID=UPI002D7F2E9E|nr:nuclear transport factor 2 family protein [Amycolatopsis sp.]HET6707644.1 nuclear transport factor 2 family protein [Amycolatopsis sp.]